MLQSLVQGSFVLFQVGGRDWVGGRACGAARVRGCWEVRAGAGLPPCLITRATPTAPCLPTPAPTPAHTHTPPTPTHPPHTHPTHTTPPHTIRPPPLPPPQAYDVTEEGAKLQNFYRLFDLPAILIIDPVTGGCWVLVWVLGAGRRCGC